MGIKAKAAPGGAIRLLLRSTSLLVLAAAGALGSQICSADVVSWVDEKGITQFGDPQLAPHSADVTAVEILPTNSMEPARAASGIRRGAGPTIVKLGLPEKRNKKGWRSDESLYTGRRHTSQRRNW